MNIVNSYVSVNMDDKDYWYAIVQKSEYKVVILCDLASNICYTFGGTGLKIVKNIKVVSDNSELYNTFIRKIGKMCKKKEDRSGHYFSDLDGYVSQDIIDRYVDCRIKERISHL